MSYAIPSFSFTSAIEEEATIRVVKLADNQLVDLEASTSTSAEEEAPLKYAYLRKIMAHPMFKVSVAQACLSLSLTLTLAHVLQ